MNTTWILVADSSRAKLFVAETHTSSLEEIEDFDHPEGRQHEQLLTSDLPGRNAGAASSHHALDDETSPKQQEAIGFAKLITKRLNNARKDHLYGQLIVVAAPAFLGLLRENMNADTEKLIALELDKNLTKESIESIRQHLPKVLPSIFT